MSEFTPKGVDDLGGPALARLRELAAQVEKAEALAQSLRAEALRFVQVLDLLGVDVPKQLRVDVPKQLRVVARVTAKTKTPVPDGERWACACGFRSVGRSPGRHPEVCLLKRGATPVPDGERWACACGFRSVGRSPGRHPEVCLLKRGAHE